MDNLPLYFSPPYPVNFYDFLKRMDNHELAFVDFLRKREHSLRHAKGEADSAASRLLSAWMKEGLIDDQVRHTKGAWIRFSLRDLIWIKIIERLRDFGMSLSQIKITKESLFTKKYWEYGDVIFDYSILLAVSKLPIILAVMDSGEAHLFSRPQIQYHEQITGLDDFLRIDLNKIVRFVFNEPDLKPIYKTAVELSTDELMVIHNLRSGGYKSIEVIMTDGRIERLKMSENIDVDKRMDQLLKDAKYQEIKILQKDGNIVSIKREIQKKI